MRAAFSWMAGVVVLGGLAVAGRGQTDKWQPAPAGNNVPGESMQGLKIAYPPLKPVPTPFPLGGRFGKVTELEFRAPEAMTADDRLMVENAQPEIERRADLAGLRLTELKGWGYEQAVCPAFPDHVVLEYSRIAEGGDVTLFAAVVPRGSIGHVRVIPVRRRGYSLWTSASSNALTLNDFNHMVKESGGLSPDWMGISLCYTALAAGHVRTALVAQLRDEEKFPMTAAPLLTVNATKAGAEVWLMDTATQERKGEWILRFDGVGHLKKVHHVQAGVLRSHPVQGISDASQFHGEPTPAP